MVKLPARSAHNLTEMNPAGAETTDKQAINPNSAVLANFQDGKKSYESSAILIVLFGLLKEPFFNQLRTQE